MPRGEDQTAAPSRVLGVYVTSDATSSGDKVEFATTGNTAPWIEGQTVPSRNFTFYTRPFLVKRPFKIIITHCPKVLYAALVAAFSLDTARTTKVYDRFLVFDGTAKPMRPAAMVSANEDHNYAGVQAREVTLTLAPVTGTWS